MNKLFVDDLVERLEYGFGSVKVYTQDVVKKVLRDRSEYLNFPMISFEHTDDSSFYVDISESKFLNDPSHAGTWIVGSNYDEIAFIVNLKNWNGSLLEIDALEIRDELRGQGFGSNVISVIESVAEQYFDSIVVSPFDTDAQNFWNKMDYEEGYNGYWVKKLNN